MKIRAALLDVDGTLVDSNDLHARAWVDAFAEAGIHVGFDRVRPLLGMGGDQLLPAVQKTLSPDSEPGRTIARRRGELFKSRYRPAVRPFPDVPRLLNIFHRFGMKCIIATSSTTDELKAMLELATIEDAIDGSVTSEDATSSKPAPDIILAALARSEVGAHEAIMLGDTRFDIQAARLANVDTIAFRCGGSTEHDLDGAIAVYDGPSALCDALQSSSIDQIVEQARAANAAEPSSSLVDTDGV